MFTETLSLLNTSQRCFDKKSITLESLINENIKFSEDQHIEKKTKRPQLSMGITFNWHYEIKFYTLISFLLHKIFY